MHTRIVWYVERELEKKGLKKLPDGQDELFVRYYAKAHEGLKGTATQVESTLPGGAGQLTTGVDFSKAIEGTLMLELQRASDEKLVWRAGTHGFSIDKKRIDAETASAVRLLISKYPPPRPTAATSRPGASTSPTALTQATISTPKRSRRNLSATAPAATFKLIAKERIGNRTIKRYDTAKSPYQRLLERKDVPLETKARLMNLYVQLNPAELRRSIDLKTAKLWKISR